MNQEHHHPEMANGLPRASVHVSYDSGRMAIQVRDADGKPVKLVKEHEKSMHLIVVSEDLESFFHVHPVETMSGDFEVELELSPGRYLAFVDINPAGLSYTVEPNAVTVGEAAEIPEIDWEALAANDSRTKEISGKLVAIQHPKLVAGETAALSFDLHGESPLPYLGAMGHVVVLDGQGRRFIHVHPSPTVQPEFQVRFPAPGVYKLWAEFHFADTGVLAFPFIVEVARQAG